MRATVLQLVLVAGLSASAAAQEEVEFRAKRGLSLYKHSRASLELTGGERSFVGTRGGAELDETVPLDSHSVHEEALSIRDTYTSVLRGQPLEMRRAFLQAARRTEIATAGHLFGPEEVASPLQELEVDFTRKTEEEPFARALVEERELDETLLNGLRADADFRFLLPGRRVSPGDKWEVPAEHMADLFFPGGALFAEPAVAEPYAPPGATGNELRAPLAGATLGAWELLREAKGELEARMVREEREGDLILAVIEVTIDAGALLNPTETFRPIVAATVPEGVDFGYAHAVHTSLEGKAILRWSILDGMPHDFELRADVWIDEYVELSATLKEPGTGREVPVDTRMALDWSGSYHLKTRAGWE